MSDASPKISVIIPVYNVEKYLATCLDSVFAQTLDPIEAICVNDGSTDSSPQILARYAAGHENMRVIHKENGGLSSARNAGLDVAAGEYIFFLDSDDRLIGEGALAELYDDATARDLDLLFFGAEMFYESEESRKLATEPPNHYHRHAQYPEVTDGRSLFCAFVENRDFRANACLLLYRRRFLEAHQLRFVKGLIHEDDVYTTQCMALAARTACVPRYPYGRFFRMGSILSSGSHLRSAHGLCVGAQILREFFETLPDCDARFRRCYEIRLRGVTERAANEWLPIPLAERRRFLNSLPDSERRAMRAWLAAAAPRALYHNFKRSVRRILRKGRRA